MTPIEQVIPEKNIVIFSPHFDDVLFMLGGYISELDRAGLLRTKNFHVIILFSRSNYLAGASRESVDTTLDRIKFVTGKRLLEDQNCNDELIGAFNYTYELAGENECFTRGKAFADAEMEFPHGMFEDFDANDHEIFQRMQQRIKRFAQQPDTALVFPMAIKEHIDHFITREAAFEVAKSGSTQATFYFQEDKPYGGIATDTELDRIKNVIKSNKLQGRTFTCDPELVIELAFKHYISQVEEVYKTGIRNRAAQLQKETNSNKPCDRIYVFTRQ